MASCDISRKSVETTDLSVYLVYITKWLLKIELFSKTSSYVMQTRDKFFGHENLLNAVECTECTLYIHGCDWSRQSDVFFDLILEQQSNRQTELLPSYYVFVRVVSLKSYNR